MDWNEDMPVYYDDMIITSVFPVPPQAKADPLKTTKPTDIIYNPPSKGCDLDNAETKKIIKEEEKLKCSSCGFKAKAIIGLRLHYFNRHQLRHTCQFCGEPFRKLRNLNSHIEEHHTKEEKLLCPHCEYDTHLQRNLKHHITQAHKQEPKFQCTTSSFSTNYSDKFESHTETHYTEKLVSPYCCTKCHFETKYYRSLKRHIMRIHEKIKEFKCHYCAFKTATNYSLKKHLISTHMHEDFYNCPFCPYIASQSEKLYQHVVYRHKFRSNIFSRSKVRNLKNRKIRSSNDKNIVSESDKSLNRNLPIRRFANFKVKNENCRPSVKTQNIVNSINVHKLKQWLCTLPFLEFYNKQSGQINMENIKEEMPKLLEDTSIPYQSKEVNVYNKDDISHNAALNEQSGAITEMNCPKCHFTCLNEKYLDEHKKVFHENKHSYECPFCDFRTVYKKSIIHHVLEQHSKSGAHQCSMCLYSTPHLDYILLHVQKHFTSERKYPSEEAFQPSRSVNISQTIQKNVPLHPNNRIKRQLHCNACTFSTSSNNDLEDHFQIHVEDADLQCKKLKPFYKKKKTHKNVPSKCHFCDFKGRGSRDLRVHIKTIHEDMTEYSCPLCEFRTAYMNSLKIHIMGQHTQERPYMCTKCPYTTVQVNNLKVHIKNKHKTNSNL